MIRVAPAPATTIPFRYETKDKFGGGYNSRDADTDIQDDEFSGGQNIDISPNESFSKRKGHKLEGNYMGPTTGILGLIPHEPQGGTSEKLAVYDTSVMRNVSGTWTALTSVTMTTNKPADWAYFPLTSKTYITNKTDAVVKYTSGTAGDQSDTSFKKGRYIVHYKNRLIVANVTSQEDYIWYSDLGVDTFSANNYIRCDGEVTGLEVLYDKLLVFTKKRIYLIQNFTFNGVAAGPESFLPLRSDFGAIADRTIVKVKDLVYFLGQNSQGIAAVYVCDGLSIGVISDKISPDIQALAPNLLTNACAGSWGAFYRLSVTPSGQTTNTKEYLWDSVHKRWLPPYTNELGGFSCYATFETSGQLDLYAGTQGSGHVYKLNQEDYEEIAEESYTTTGSYDGAIDANPAKRISQSFKLSDYTTTDDVPVNSVWLRLKKNAGTTTGLTVRIETNNNGVPSGVLADAQATTTIDAFTSTSYAYYKATFSNVTLSGNTTYWIVVKHTTEGTGTSQYYWGGNGSSPTYSNGNLATYSDSTSGTSSFSPDASPESTSVDGYVGRGSVDESFATIRGGAGNDSNDTGTTISASIFCSATTNQFSQISRGIVLFDTSALPNDAVISSATLKLYCTSKTTTTSQSVGITSGTPAANTGLAQADYATANFGSTRFVSDVVINNLTTNAYNDFALNASGISAVSLTSITKFAIRISGDIDNSAPTWSSEAERGANFSSADGLNPPILTITYTSAGGSAIWTSDATKDQNFLMYIQGSIDGFAETKAFYLAPPGQYSIVRSLFVTADATGTHNIEVGLNTGTFAGYSTTEIPLSTGGAVLGSSFEFGESSLGGTDRAENFIRTNNFKSRTIKFRFRNANANEDFTLYNYRIKYQILNKFR